MTFTKFLRTFSLQSTSGQLSMCFVFYFSKFEMEKLFEWFSSITETVALNSVSKSLDCCNCHQNIVFLIKFPQWYLQSEAPQSNFEKFVPSVNDHPAFFKIIPKFYKNGSCIHTISFLLTMMRPMTCLFTIISIHSIQQSTRNRNLETIWKMKQKQGNKLIVLLR